MSTSNQQPSYHFVSVEWTSPSGRMAPSDRLLSLGEYDGSVSGDWSFLAFDGDYNRYLFGSLEEARAFKREVQAAYQKNPQYFVIDDDGNVVRDRDGDSIVAWEPDLSISPASAKDVERLLPESAALGEFAA